MAIRGFGRTMSGLPGRSDRCSRYLYPSWDRLCRTASSGFVSRDLIRDMFQLRRFTESLSVMWTNYQKGGLSQVIDASAIDLATRRSVSERPESFTAAAR